MSTIERKFKVGAGLEFGDGTSVTTAAGLVGATGAQGSQGNTGQTGSTGPIGSTGAQGNIGATGAQGNTGSTGAQGIGYNLTSTSSVEIGVGMKTFTVSQDASISAFKVGNFVAVGYDNSNFVFGQIATYSGTSLTVYVTSITGSGTYSAWGFVLSGAPGYAGATGAAGSNGTNGDVGATGAQGNIGATGAQGSTGAQGDQGIGGNTGSTGATGAQGNAGATGAQGNAGSTGATGIQGATGQTGLGFTIAKTYASVAALNADTSPSGIVAGQFALIDTGSVQDADTGKLYLWNGSVYSYVIDLSGAQGIQGQTGATGPNGATGAQGNIGATGAAGTNGDIGATGAQGNIGATGAQGATGAAGTNGTNGTNGDVGATGASGIGYNLTSTSSITIGTGTKTFTVSQNASISAFKVGNYVAVGYDNSNFMFGQIAAYSGTSLTVYVTNITGSGTYAAWGFVLSGAPGQSGATGAQGNAGATGAAGATGIQGSTGPQGPGANQSVDTTSQVSFASVTASNFIQVLTPDPGATYIPFRTSKTKTFQVYRTGITSTATQNILDMGLESAGFNTFKYLITIVDNNAGTKRTHSQEMLSVVNSGNVYESEYSIVLSSDSLGSFNTIVNGDSSRSLEWVPANITSATVIVTLTALSD
jgi:uncharacterized protein YqfB (UPF0267 family)